jgi:hypothetical protein
MFSDIPEPEVRKCTSLTAAHVYGFDLNELQIVADRVGPSVKELGTPLTTEERPTYPTESRCPSFLVGYNPRFASTSGSKSLGR